MQLFNYLKAEVDSQSTAKGSLEKVNTEATTETEVKPDDRIDVLKSEADLHSAVEANLEEPDLEETTDAGAEPSDRLDVLKAEADSKSSIVSRMHGASLEKEESTDAEAKPDIDVLEVEKGADTSQKEVKLETLAEADGKKTLTPGILGETGPEDLDNIETESEAVLK